MFAIPVTGERPLCFSVDDGQLPEGLRLDAQTGIISGVAGRRGKAKLVFAVANQWGTTRRELHLIIGDTIALTPPMGWNSWNCWGDVIDAGKILAAAEQMVASGLAAHGYSYVNIDAGWQGRRGGKHHAIQGNQGFPDMRGLCDAIHRKGLKAGIYSTPWVRSYFRVNKAGFTGGSAGKNSGVGATDNWSLKQKRYVGVKTYDNEDAKQWAAWGFDYLKYDWFPNEVLSTERMRNALATCGRDMIYSLSNRAPFELASEWARLANSWRTTGDIIDTWESVSGIGFQQDKWSQYTGPGHWSDPDMLVVGRLGWSNIRDCRLTRDEQITHLSLWALLAAPLMIGCDLSQLDELTMQLLCNDEVVAVNQDSAGRQACCVKEVRHADCAGETRSHHSVYVKRLCDNSIAVGLFNRGPRDELIAVSWPELDLSGPMRARNIWANADIGVVDGSFRLGVPAHGAQLVRMRPATSAGPSDNKLKRIKLSTHRRKYTNVWAGTEIPRLPPSLKELWRTRCSG